MSWGAGPSAATPGRAGRGRRACRAAAGLLLACSFALLAAACLAAGCGEDADPFEGLYRERSSARRIEIRRDGEAYWLYYGADKQPFRAERDGDELRITGPMGGETIVRPGDDEGTLELVDGDAVSLLRPVSEDN